jgi:multidrug efflux pump subunit AcrA (membrane-fusion protein)
MKYTKVGNLPRNYTVAKTWKMSSNAQVSVSAQGVGRIEQILVKEGVKVKKGQVIAKLKDTTANYDLRLAQASNTVATVRNTAKSTEITLDKAVKDTEIALAKAKADLRTTEETAARNLEKAERDALKSVINWDNTDASTTLAQLEASLTKANQDYENLIVSNTQTLLNFNTSYQASVSDFKKLVSKLVFEWDRLYGITPKYQSENTLVRQYLGGNSLALKPSLEFAFYDLQKIALELDMQQPVSFTENDHIVAFDAMKKRYTTVRLYLDMTTKYLENSTVGAQFPQTQLDGYLAINNGYKTELSGLENAWVNFRNSASLFLANYKNNEESAYAGYLVQKKNFEVQQKNLANGEFDSKMSLDKLKISNAQAINTAKTTLESAELMYENAKKNKGVTLEKLRLAEKDALLAETQANEEFSKLTITAPIDGSVTRVIASLGVETSVGTPVVEISSASPEILFEVEANIVPLLAIGSEQVIRYMDTSFTGTVVWLSQVATDTLLYNARVSLPSSSSLLWQVATIELNIKSNNPVMPLDAIKVISDKTGEIQVLQDDKIVTKEVSIVRIIGAYAEIKANLDKEEKIIVSSTLWYDAKKYQLKTGEVTLK